LHRLTEEIQMSHRTILGAVAIGAFVVTLMGCGGSAAASASTAVGAGPSTAGPSSAASSAPESSTAAPSSAGSGLAIPSFALPSGAKDLEALLPAQLCGETAIKLSMTGPQFTATADPTFKAILQALGKQASDVSFAVAAAPTSGCTAGIFRVAGVDPNRLQESFLAQQRTSGSTVTQGSVGGKSVYISDQGASAPKEYVYFKGDAVIFAQAKDEASAATILQQLP
jgi:hypothetical protein